MTQDWKGPETEGSILTAGDMKKEYEIQLVFSWKLLLAFSHIWLQLPDQLMEISRTERGMKTTLFSLGLERDERHWIYQFIMQRENRHTFTCCSIHEMWWSYKLDRAQTARRVAALWSQGIFCIILQKRRRALLPACDCCLTKAGHLLYLFNAQLLPATLVRNAFRQIPGFHQ